jgi:predicted MFS family arabinose efflux permease
MALVAVVLHRRLPDSPAELRGCRYRTQLRGIAQLVGTQPVLRWRAAVGACAFAAFGCFWTTVTFLLDGRYQLSQLQIGLFALLGVAGAGSATLAGRSLATRPRHQRWPITAALAVVLAVSFAPIYLGGVRLGWLIAGVLVMDAAMQALNVANQTVVYDLLPRARSRLSTVYATTMFTGGAAGSLLGADAYAHHGWPGAAATAAAFALAALTATAGSRRHEQPQP